MKLSETGVFKRRINMDLSAKLNRKEHGGKLSHSQAWI